MMKKRPKSSQSNKKPAGIRKLTDEENMLWQQVASTVTPTGNLQNLDHFTIQFAKEMESQNSIKRQGDASQNRQILKSRARADSYTPPISAGQKQSRSPGNIDDRTAKKLLRGKISIDDRIDLHGMTQSQAYARLQLYLYNAFNSGFRHVLVITGKGRLSGGILRQLVPLWLKEPQFANYVSAFRQSHISHGGEGALYVRVKKKK